MPKFYCVQSNIVLRVSTLAIACHLAAQTASLHKTAPVSTVGTRSDSFVLDKGASRIASGPTIPPPVDEDLRIASGPTIPPPVDEDLRIASGPTIPPPVDEDLRIIA